MNRLRPGLAWPCASPGSLIDDALSPGSESLTRLTLTLMVMPMLMPLILLLVLVVTPRLLMPVPMTLRMVLVAVLKIDSVRRPSFSHCEEMESEIVSGLYRELGIK